MARVQRAFVVATAALGLLGPVILGLSNAHTSGPSHVTTVAAARVVTTTTTTVAPTTTTTAPAPPVTQQRPSRHLERPRPVPAPPAAFEGITPEWCGHWGGGKTRAQSDACWRDEVAKYGGWNVNAMLTIIWCESHGDPWAGTRYVGLLQVDNAPETRGDGPANIAVGHRKFEGQGYSAWPTCRHRAGV